MFNRSKRYRAAALAATGAVALSGCAHYTPAPLAAEPPLVPAVTDIAGAGAGAGPLSVEQVVVLALANNPDLKAVRLRRGVAEGQTTQAGVLPNPTISGAILPLLSGAGSVPAWNFGIAQDIKAIITYKSRQRAARDSQQQVAADVVWQEWQIAGRARQLAADLIMGARARPNYAAAFTLLTERNAQLDRALAGHLVTLTTVAPDRVALQNARSALDALDQRQLSLVHQLNALLGLRPDAAVVLADTIDLPPLDAAEVRAALPTLPQRRPDLLALRLGYAAADENLRQAILSQFPDMVLGASVASDNAKVINGGPNVQIGLPIFDRNQGNIAIGRATRAQLQAEYAARLAATSGEVGAMLAEIEQMTAQLAVARRDLPAAQLAARRAQAAFGASNLDERGFVDLVSIRFAKEQEIMTLETAVLDRRIALQTLIGAGLPTVDLPPEPGTGASR